jgi:tRNA(Ile)-lysidine synthase
VSVNPRSGEGPEAAARRARYDALRRVLQAGEKLLTAHHLDDQAETLVLNLLRGSGATGLGGIPPRAPLGAGQLLRPLLNLPRAELLAYAQRHGQRWIEDPANLDTRLDRNYLRHIVMPALRNRWPSAVATIGRSARLCGEAAQLLEAMAASDARSVVRRQRIAIPRLCRLETARQRNLLRYLCRRQLGSVPAEARLAEGLAQLVGAAPDRSPVLRWPGGEIRRYRESLYLLDPGWEHGVGEAGQAILPGQWLDLGPPRGRLSVALTTRDGGIAASLVQTGLQVRFRSGGERLRLAGQAHHRDLKRLLQEHGVVPWMRRHLPLLYSAERLVAVADLWVAAECVAPAGERGYRVRWDGHPAIR